MKKIFRPLSIIIITAFVITNCSSTKDIYLDQEYQKSSLNSEFVVIPLKSSWLMEGSKYRINPSEEDYFYRGLERSFNNNAASDVKFIEPDFELERNKFELKKLTSKNVNINANLPPKELLDSFPERYVYFFESFGFNITQKNVAASSYAGQEKEVIVKRRLNFNTEFFLLDKQTEKIISWGKIDESKSIGEKPKFEDYQDLIDAASKQIINEGPFIKK